MTLFSGIGAVILAIIRSRYTLTALTSLTFDVSCLLNVGPKGKISVASLTNTLLLSHAAHAVNRHVHGSFGLYATGRTDVCD